MRGTSARMNAWLGALTITTLLAACSGPSPMQGLTPFQQTADTWVGAPAAELRNAWGDWDGSRDLGGLGRQLVYSRSRVLAGSDVGCEVRFDVSPQNIVTRARVSGTVGACRQMLLDAPPYRGGAG